MEERDNPNFETAWLPVVKVEPSSLEGAESAMKEENDESPSGTTAVKPEAEQFLNVVLLEGESVQNLNHENKVKQEDSSPDHSGGGEMEVHHSESLSICRSGTEDLCSGIGQGDANKEILFTSYDDADCPTGNETWSDVDVLETSLVIEPIGQTLRDGVVFNEDEQYNCPICSMSFIVRDVYEAHMQEHDRKVFNCTLCSKSYLSSVNLTRHITHIHEGVRFNCDICSKSFSRRYHLDDHMQTHIQGLYSCSLCEKSYSSKNNLNEHLRTHKEGRKFSCSICTESFSSKAWLRVHLKWHKGIRYKCSLCEKYYSSKNGLQEHVRTHENVRFDCTECSKSFRTRRYFEQHLRSHKDGGPTCTVCFKSLSSQRTLRLHLQMHELKGEN